MRVVIAGASALGRATARQLIEAGHEVVVIDRDRERLEKLSESHDCGLIEGDVTLPTILREAGGESPDAIFALTNSDEDNILCAVVARSIGFEKVVPQIIKPELCAICDELQLSDMITPHETVAASLLDRLEDRDATAHEAHLTGDLRLMSYEVAGALGGSALDDLPLGEDARAVALRRGDADSLPEGSTTLQNGDKLILIARRDASEALMERLSEEDGE